MVEHVLCLLKKCKKPVTYKELVFQMGLSKKESKHLKKYLRKLLKEGKVIRTRKGKYGIAEEMKLLRGYFILHPEGYGFVVPETVKQKDIYIPPWATMGALDGDKVVVRLEDEKRLQGRIIRILNRINKKVVGRIEFSKGLFFVKPKRKNLRFNLFIPPEERKRKKVKIGELVIAEVLNYSSEDMPAIGRIIKSLKEPDTPKKDIELIINEFGLPKRFPHNVIEEVKKLPKKISKVEKKRRKDLRSLNTVTIDGEKAMDFDDAISIEHRDFGYTLYVHIADVGYFVPWESKIDLEARERGNSVYLPDKVIPMLPKRLSEGLCSLNPSVERLAFTVEMDFSKDGERIAQRFYPSIIKSDERMTYTNVNKIIVDNDSKLRTRYNRMLQDFETMAELCHILKERRLKRGSLDFDLPEAEIKVDINGNPIDITTAQRNIAHMIIEEFMIAANEAVAEFLFNKGIPCIYRIHAAVEPDKLIELTKAIKAMTGIRKSISVDDLSDIIISIKGKKEEEIINYIILRSLKQARYSTENIGHFGLASSCYTHFTSPIRRYPDLVVHRILKEVISEKSKDLKQLYKLLKDIAFHSTQTERIADEVEREVIKSMGAWFMKQRIGDVFDAKVISLTPYSLKVRLKDYFVEGIIHVSYMSDDYYIFDEENFLLKGKRTKKLYTIGDEIKVIIENVNLTDREVIFGLIS